MSRITLELNGVSVPLPDDADIAINLKAKDIRNVATASGSYAETMVLPDTNRTRQVLGNSQYVTSGTQTPYRLLRAVVKADGNPVLTGSGAHNEVNEGFAVDINAQNADLFAIIKGKNLQELDLSDLDHSWTKNNVKNANTHNPARGYLYPLINYGKLTNRLLYRGNTRFDELYPAVYARTILERMVAPFTLTGTLLSDAKFSRLVVPFANELFRYRESFRLQYDGKAVLPAPIFPAGLSTPAVINFGNIVSDGSGSMANTSAATVYTTPMLGMYYLDLKLILDTLQPANTTGGSFEIILWNERNGNIKLIDKIEVGYGVNQSIDFTAEYYCQAGDKLYVQIIPAYFSQNNKIHAGATFKVSLQPQTYEQGPVHLEANLPDVSQEDFFLTICNMFNVLIQTDTVRGVVRLDLMESMRYQTAADWSKKIDWNREPGFRFALDGYGQENFISYAESDQEATDFKGRPLVESIVLPVDNEQLSRSEELYSSPFTLTQTQPAYRSGALLPFIPLFSQNVQNYGIYSPNTDHVPGDHVYYGGLYFRAEANNTNNIPGTDPAIWTPVPESDVFTRVKATPRLLLVEKRPITAPIYVGTDYQAASAVPLYVQGTFEGLTGEALKADYHGLTVAMLQQTRIMTLNVRLRLPDISSLDFLRPVMLNIPAKNMQGVFYLNAVNQYRPGKWESTEVELVRLFGFPLVAGAEVTHKEFTEEFSSEFN